MSTATQRRIYKTVSVEPHGTGYAVALDNKLVITPQRRVLAVPIRALAEAIAAEWRAQGAVLDPLSMPLTRLAGSAHDLVAPNRAEIVARTADFGATDLLCYRATTPADLAARQAQSWQPWVDWAAERHGARLTVTEGVIAVEQSEAARAALARAVEGYDDLRLAGLAAATAALGSLVLALALAEGRLDAEAAWALSLLDEIHQVEHWGEVGEAAKARAALKADIEAAGRLLALLAGV
jgi:chaperone required for assembly of F1-ATPase